MCTRPSFPSALRIPTRHPRYRVDRGVCRRPAPGTGVAGREQWGIERHVLDDGAGRVGDDIDRAQMIGQQILCLRGPGAGRGRGIDDDGNTGDGQLAHGLAGRGDGLVGAAGGRNASSRCRSRWCRRA